MNIAKLNELIPASFDYEYTDAADNKQTETINLKLRRMSFKQTASADFRNAMGEAESNPQPIAELLAGLIAEWDIYEGDDVTKMLPINAATIAALPVEFVGALAECVFKRLFPDPQKAANSVNGSEPAAKSSLTETATASAS